MYIYNNGFKAKSFYENIEHPLAKLFLEELEQTYHTFKGKPIETLNFSKFKLYAQTGSRVDYENIYFFRRLRLVTFILKVWLEGKKEDISELEDALWAVCDEYTWALPAHIAEHKIDLFAAETAHAVSEALSLCGKMLDEQVKSRCVDEVFKRVIEPFEDEFHRFETATNNWAAVCGGAVGMTALYLVEDLERLKSITDRAIKSCNNFIANCPDDGGCLEGVMYWDYAMSYYVGFAELLRQRTGKVMICNNEKLKRLSEFPSCCYLGGGNTISFSDSLSNCNVSFGTVCKLGEIFSIKMPEYEYYTKLFGGNYSVCIAIRNIEWFNPSIISEGFQEENHYLPMSQWAVLKNENGAFAIKGGHNGEPHNHNDVGSFIYVKANEFIAKDLGQGEYTEKYFLDHYRYSYINTSSLGHSVPVVNKQAQINGSGYRSGEFSLEKNIATVSFADAYDKKNADLERLERTAVFEIDELCIKDKFEFSKKGNLVEERLITGLDAEVLSERKVALKENEQIKATIEFSCDGKIGIIHDSIIAHKTHILQAFNIISFEAFTEMDKCEISYIIR